MTDELTVPAEAAPDVANKLPVGVRIDLLENAMAALPQIDHRLTHRFTPGMYIRQIIMPKGSIYTSKIHKTEHPYVVLSGLVSVMREDGTWEHISGGHFGITKPGTRRVLAVHEETTWLTFHATDETDLEKIEQHVIEPHDFRNTLNQEDVWLG